MAVIKLLAVDNWRKAGDLTPIAKSRGQLQARVSACIINHVIRKIDQQLSQATLSRGVVAQDGRECSISQGLGKALPKCFASSGIVAKAQEAAYDMLKKTCSLLLNELGHHVAEDGANSVESLVSGANVVQAIVVEQNLLHNEDGDRLAQLGSCLHNTQTQWDDLGSQEEVDNLGRIVLNQSPNNTERSKSQVFKGT